MLVGLDLAIVMCDSPSYLDTLAKSPRFPGKRECTVLLDHNCCLSVCLLLNFVVVYDYKVNKFQNHPRTVVPTVIMGVIGCFASDYGIVKTCDSNLSSPYTNTLLSNVSIFHSLGLVISLLILINKYRYHNP